jgi:hypothetical protein
MTAVVTASSRAMVREPGRLRPSVAVLGGLLLFIVIVQVGWSIAVILYPGEVLYSEAVVYDKAARLLRGQALYQPLDRPPYTVTAYTPLYYWLAAGLQAVDPGFGPGRGLSLIAWLATAGLVGHLAARLLSDRRAGAFAALLFLALGQPGVPAWSTLYREQLLGVALSLGAIATLFGGTTPRRLILSGMLAALAILTKQTLIAAGVAGVVWLWRCDRRKAAVFTGTTLAITLGTCLMLEITTGAFLANTVVANVNPFSSEVLVSNLASFLLFQAGPLGVTGLYLASRPRTSPGTERELLVFYWVASLLPLVGLAKVGSNLGNYWIELAAITAVLATLGTWTGLRTRAVRWERARAVGPILLLVANVTVVTLLAGASARFGLSVLGSSPKATGAEELISVIERVRSEPGEVSAEPLDVVVLAGRPVLFEPYIFSILHREGRWDAGPLARSICAGELKLLVLDQRLDSTDNGLHGYTHWPPPILAALRQTMVLESEQAGRFLYVPRENAPSQGCEV